ncbi:hypothetical protein N7510_005442 [Penicillium lagena]|uniref:uncharacterized protein n=1 Tax=Penicillium lagena TaxID=94218 RepID=UPI0025410EC1|nr:uncharacterized protein N7510_005442 [Penicillium lagena]KAJ5612248.1 hypothetical protein N7510_005442 [Penicillium lagena]
MSGKYVFTKGLKELRFLFCHTSEQSAPTRTFLNRAYPTMKKHNPHTPIMMREAMDTEPRVFARYGMDKDPLKTDCQNRLKKEYGLTMDEYAEFGKEKQEALSGLSEQQIEERITNLVKASS